ncbi:hypothetical protein JHFBIEKO_3076 [Methylobacterium mesophilicum]|nr:glycosyl transferase family 90 [Methylobacterium mesophilicum]GJE22620.1 hypothetical protein JHFBIEKO_3076 [Methylobacterium mesophilicum]
MSWQAAPPSIRDQNAMIAFLIEQQLLSWKGRSLDKNNVEKGLFELNNYEWAYVYKISGEKVSKLEKNGSSPTNQAYENRSDAYLRLLQKAFAGAPTHHDFMLGICVNDCAPDLAMVPTFSFQKRVDQSSILLPDIDFLTNDFYENFPRDSIHYDDKNIVASFAGATSGGGEITAETIRANPFPRLRAARFFRDCDEVIFRLPALVQCDEEARAILLEEGWGHGHVSWDVSYNSRFGISIDGNGAACSRPALVLGSKSVLIKYASEHVLFYFPAMIDGVHFVGVHSDQEVLDIVKRERSSPGTYREIAGNGREFAHYLFDRAFMYRYTRRLMHEYYCLMQ